MTEQTPNRVFKIGNIRIVEDASLAGKTPQEVQKLLSPLYPQIENASIREHTDEASGITTVTYIQPAGRKG